MPVFTVYRLTLLAAACASLSACSSFDFASGRVTDLVRPYKAEIVQGNFVSKEQKEALQVGMSRAQVQEILGSPLITSAFHGDRWDYVFTIRRQGAEPQQRKLSVFFQGDQFSKAEGDALMVEQDFVASLSTGRNLGKVPVLELPTNQLPAPVPSTPASSAGTPSSNASAPSRVYPPLESPAR
jgi:outer membrane protein assembly factor BamE